MPAAATAPPAPPASPSRAKAGVVPAATPASPLKAAQPAPPPPALPTTLDRDGLQACVEGFVADRVKGSRLVYDPSTASAWAATLVGELREAVRGFLEPTHRYKVVAHVEVAQRVGQGLARAAGCLWAAGGKGGGVGGSAQELPNTDGCGVGVAENEGVGVVATAFVFYVH